MSKSIYLFEINSLVEPAGQKPAFLANVSDILQTLEEAQYKVIVTSVQDFAKISALNIAPSQGVLCRSAAELRHYIAQFSHEKLTLFVNHFSHHMQWVEQLAQVTVYIIDPQDNILPEPHCYYANDWAQVKHLFGG